MVAIPQLMNTLYAVHQLNLREMKRIWPTLIRAMRYLQSKKGNVLMRETFRLNSFLLALQLFS